MQTVIPWSSRLLNTKWDLYHHNGNNDWTKQSYFKLFTLESVQSYAEVIQHGPELSMGLFFLMRTGIDPIWEHPRNENGGVWSFKVHYEQASDAWNQLLARVLGENLLEEEIQRNVTGISIHPKYTPKGDHSCSVVKLWMADVHSDLQFLEPKLTFLDPNKAIFKPHKKGSNFGRVKESDGFTRVSSRRSRRRKY